MLTLGFIKGGAAGQARVDYYLSRAQLETYPRGVQDRTADRERLADGVGMAGYYGSHAANGPGRWAGRGATALGVEGLVASPEEFTRAVLEGYLDGQVRTGAKLRTHPEGLLAAEPLAAAVRAAAAARGVEPALLFRSGRAGREWAGLARKADRYQTVPASVVDKLARAVGGIDPAVLYGGQEWARALVMAAPERRVDDRLAAVDVVMSADKSVSLLYATADPTTRSLIVSEFREANRAALGYLDTLAAVGRRGQGGAVELQTDGLVAVGFVHDEARPTGGCVCGDPHLHEHMIVLNVVRGQDGGWSGAQLDRLAPAAKTAGYLQEADLRARLTARLGVVWRPVVNGLSAVVGITDAQHRQFSKRHNEVAAALAEVGAAGLAAGNAAGRDTKQAKRAQLPLAERVAFWQAEAATVGLTAATLADVLHPPATAPPRAEGDPGQEDRAADKVVLEQLTAQASSFGRPELLRALASAARQGASVPDLTGRADAILADPTLAVPLAAGRGALTTGDVRRGAGGRVFAYAVEQKWTTPSQLALEQRLVDAALARDGEGCGRLDGDLVELVIGGQPFVLSDEQADAVRRLTTSGAGVDVLVAGAGSGKTSAVLGSVRQAYELAGFHVVGAATSAKAARVLADDGGLQTSTVARLLLDLQQPQAGGLGGRPGGVGAGMGAGTVLVLDEASMVGTRDMAAVLEHARAAAAKVIVVGDPRQLAPVDAGGGLRALADRLGAQTLTANRRQQAGWERQALAALAAGRPGEALRAYTAHDRVTVVDTGLAARRAMVTGWWADVAEHGITATLLVAVRNTDRVELNRLARDLMREAGRLGEDQVSAGGRTFAVGDRVVLLRNGSARRYDNGDTGTVTAVDDQRRLVVTLDRGTSEVLPLAYTAAGHVDHAYAGTVHKAQGSTVLTAHVLGTALGRESGYVALSRGRAENRLYLVEGEGQGDVELGLPAPQQRQAYEQAARTLGTSQAKHLALDTTVWGERADALHAELDGAALLLRARPPSDTARLPMLRAEAARLGEQAAAAEARLAGLSERLDGLRRRSPERAGLQARVEEQTGALAHLQARLEQVTATVRGAELGVSPAQLWTAEQAPALVRAVAAGRELSWRSRAAERAAAALNQAVVALDVAPRAAAPPMSQPAVQPADDVEHPVPVRRLIRESPPTV